MTISTEMNMDESQDTLTDEISLQSDTLETPLQNSACPTPASIPTSPEPPPPIDDPIISDDTQSSKEFNSTTPPSDQSYLPLCPLINPEVCPSIPNLDNSGTGNESEIVPAEENSNSILPAAENEQVDNLNSSGTSQITSVETTELEETLLAKIEGNVDDGKERKDECPVMVGNEEVTSKLIENQEESPRIETAAPETPVPIKTDEPLDHEKESKKEPPVNPIETETEEKSTKLTSGNSEEPQNLDDKVEVIETKVETIETNVETTTTLVKGSAGNEKKHLPDIVLNFRAAAAKRGLHVDVQIENENLVGPTGNLVLGRKNITISFEGLVNPNEVTKILKELQDTIPNLNATTETSTTTTTTDVQLVE